MEKKRLLLIGGIDLSRDIVNAAREMGIEVYVTDYLEDSPCKKIADKSFMVNALDVDGLVDLCKEQSIDGIISGFVDMLMPYCTKVTTKMGMPTFVTQEQIDKTTNKNQFSAMCESFRIPVAKRYIVRKDYLDEDLESLVFPVILKPADASGGKGVRICNNKEDLINAFDETYSFSTVGEVIVERYITGREATLFYLMQDGNVHLTAVADRHIRQDQEKQIPLPVAYSLPSHLTQHYIDTIDEKAKKMFRTIGVENGMAFIQCKLADDTFYFYDIGLRLTGSLEYKLLEKTCGFNPLNMMINFAVNGKMSDKDITSLVNPMHKKISGNLTILCKPGEVAEVIGTDKFKKVEGVIDYHQSYYEGDTIPEKALGTLAQVTMRVFFVCDSREDMAKAMDAVLNEYDVKSKTGESLVLPVFDTDELFDKNYN